MAGWVFWLHYPDCYFHFPASLPETDWNRPDFDSETCYKTDLQANPKSRSQQEQKFFLRSIGFNTLETLIIKCLLGSYVPNFFKVAIFSSYQILFMLAQCKTFFMIKDIQAGVRH